MIERVPFTPRERELVFSVALRYMKNFERAEEVTQEALLTAYRHRDQFRGSARATTWLYRVAATTALMHLRKRATNHEELDESLVSGVSNPEENAANHEAVLIAGDELSRMG